LLTAAEALAASLSAVPAVLVVAAYLLDRAGGACTPALMLAIGLATGFTAWAATGPRAVRDQPARRDLPPWIIVVVLTAAWLIWMARPAFFPLGSGPDLTHHLLLIQYIEQHWRLVHQAGIEDYLGEMVHYTPGSHILTALLGAWTGSTGLHVLHAVLASTVALKVGFVWLVARRSLARSFTGSIAGDPRGSSLVAMLAAVALLASPTFFLGSFLDFSFVAQVVAELFVVAMWWALTAWDDGVGWGAVLLAALFGAAAFLTWPIVVGPPLLVLGCLVLLPSAQSFRSRMAQALAAVALVGSVAALFIAGRTRLMVIAGAGGAAVWPGVRLYGWWFLVASTAGIVWAGTRLWSRASVTVAGTASRGTCARATFLFVLAILLQTAALYAFATVNHNVPYMASKMFYLLLYPQAVGVAHAAGAFVQALQCTGPRVSTRTAAALCMCLLGAAAVAVARMPENRTFTAFGGRPATSRPLEQAGLWARAHLPRSCVEYLVTDAETAYWLHLAVLGNPRAGARTADNATYELTPTLVRWLTPGGLPYAVADLPGLPAGVRADLDIMQSFGTAAVVGRRGPTFCAGLQPSSTAPARR
jgi:hypothetical protein